MKTHTKHWLSPQILVIAMLCMSASFGIGVQTTGEVQTIAHTNAEDVARLAGDMDGNGKVDLADAIETLEIARGYKSATAEQLRNEPTEDGAITIDDALRILRDLHTRAL